MRGRKTAFFTISKNAPKGTSGHSRILGFIKPQQPLKLPEENDRQLPKDGNMLLHIPCWLSW